MAVRRLADSGGVSTLRGVVATMPEGPGRRAPWREVVARTASAFDRCVAPHLAAAAVSRAS
ncbi:hypothetical protein EDM22_08810 [Agromyces tardus]|uniref:Uncharacterized protein n=1 Tax=Agromyces tardus TaxID=2583849 RepID=A0A3M8AFR6_9MICO|nr:hypothetical protein EDM22_08810 [Agromyces tardus]